MGQEHHYATTLEWTGDTGAGYKAYDRTHTVRIANKPELITTSDPAFLGDPTKHNPEDLLVAALSSCHLLTYLALCARARIVVTAYRDNATGTMASTPDGGGHFTEVVLHPEVTVSEEGMLEKARHLHAAAHKYCFIANSVNFPVRHEPVVRVG
ncbi:MAG TPA: OsmC family protein [Flavobacteriales bacterium]|nr:OsmC family protein [Flavobacteriales bacterium]